MYCNNVGVTESCSGTVLEGMNGFGVLGSERNCVNPKEHWHVGWMKIEWLQSC
jgi:hypothetical protein